MFKQLFKQKPDVTKSNFEFKMRYAFDKRKNDSDNIKNKFPDKLPVIIEKLEATPVKDIDDHMYLVNKDINIGQILVIIRQKLNIDPNKCVYVYLCNGVAPSTSQTINELYDKYSDKDGFLYIMYYA